MAASAHRVETLLGKLSDCILGDHASPQVLTLAKTILAGRFAPTVEADLYHVTEAIKRKLVVAGKGSTEKALVFSDLARKLNASPVLVNKWAILYLLDSLAGAPSAPAPLSSRPLLALPSAYTAPSTSTKAPPSRPHGASDSAGSDFIRNDFSALSQYLSDVVSPSNELSESALLRDVIFAFQGIDGSYVHYDSDAGGYAIAPQHRVSRGTRDLVRRVTEMGWLFRRLRAYLARWQAHEAAGVVGQAFCAVLQDELADYFRLLAVLEAKVLAQTAGRYGDPSLTAAMAASAMALASPDPAAAGGLTLRRLLVWVQEPMQRLKTLAVLADAVQGRRGGELTSTVHGFTRHGDVAVTGVVAHVLERVSAPLLEMTLRWLLDGELADPHGEFYVADSLGLAAPLATDSSFWRARYTLRPAMMPLFLPAELCALVFSIGKTVTFIRVVCGDSVWALPSELRGRAAALTPGDVDGLASLAAAASEAANAHVRWLMLSRYKLVPQLEVLQAHLLLGKGDFARQLLDTLAPELDKPAGTVYRHNLLGLVEAALRSTTPIRDPELAERLSVRMLEPSPGDSGWDVFSLDYHIAAPLSTVVPDNAVAAYHRLFAFLWRLKRAEVHVGHVWTSHVTAEHSLRTLPELRGLITRCHLLRHDMGHFVHNLQQYLMFELAETAAVLGDAIERGAGVEAYVAAHERYLADTLDRVLLSGKHEALLGIIGKILVVIGKFRQAQDVFFTSALEEVARRQQAERMAYQRQLEGKWGVAEGGAAAAAAAGEAAAFRLTPEAREQLLAFHGRYAALMAQLLGALGGQSSSSLRNLLFRLDFNGFYSAAAAATAAAPAPAAAASARPRK